MRLSDFRKIPLLRTFVSIDPETTHVVRHEVRRDPKSGLTLTAKFALDTTNAQTKGET